MKISILLIFFGLLCVINAKFNPNDYEYWVYPNAKYINIEKPLRPKNFNELNFLAKIFPKMTVYFKPKIICINLGDDGCINGPIFGSGADGKYLNGGRNPGK